MIAVHDEVMLGYLQHDCEVTAMILCPRCRVVLLELLEEVIEDLERESLD